MEQLHYLIQRDGIYWEAKYPGHNKRLLASIASIVPDVQKNDREISKLLPWSWEPIPDYIPFNIVFAFLLIAAAMAVNGELFYFAIPCLLFLAKLIPFTLNYQSHFCEQARHQRGDNVRKDYFNSIDFVAVKHISSDPNQLPKKFHMRRESIKVKPVVSHPVGIKLDEQVTKTVKTQQVRHKRSAQGFHNKRKNKWKVKSGNRSNRFMVSQNQQATEPGENYFFPEAQLNSETKNIVFPQQRDGNFFSTMHPKTLSRQGATKKELKSFKGIVARGKVQNEGKCIKPLTTICFFDGERVYTKLRDPSLDARVYSIREYSTDGEAILENFNKYNPNGHKKSAPK